MEMNNPERGDVMVFRYPADPGLDYIKRVIGVPGDLVEYRDKKVTVNGQPVPTTNAGTYSYVGNGLNYITAIVHDERLNGVGHTMMTEPGKPSVYPSQVVDFPYRENCSYNAEGEGFACKIPAGHYFMMGDNRDASNDSRYWGFVPDRNIVGKAFFIWMNFDDLGRIGTTIR
jgi:signal peptidase I